MQVFKYQKLDAFTAKGSTGNPAAVLFLSSEQQINDGKMLEIAKQHAGFVSEVIYCKTSVDSIHLTYFSSECEVDFCGHGTIACMYSLIKNDPELIKKCTIQIETNKKGKLTVYNKIREQDAVFITAPSPVFIGTDLSAHTIAQQLGIAEELIDRTHPIDLIDAGLRTLIVPIKDLMTERSIFPNQTQLKEFCLANDIDIILISSLEVEDKTNIAHTRVFAPKFGYLEDPATGSGNSAFGYYLLKQGIWDGSDCRIEQGGNDRVSNSVQLSTHEAKLLFGGGASLRIDGFYYVE